MKKDVWAHIYRLVKPYRKKLLITVIITLLGTAASLVEPLVYREAINDVAGLFVEQAKEDVRNHKAGTPDEDIDPITGFVQKEISSAEQKIIAPEANPPKKHRVKHPHTSTHVAGRTPEEAIETLIWAVSILFCLGVIGYILWLIGDNMEVRLNCLIEQRFIKGAFSHVLKLPLGFFAKRSPAAISKQIDQSEEVTEIIGAVAQKILPEAIGLIGILAIMFWQNSTLTLIAVAIIPIYLIIAWRSSKKLETSLDNYYERWEDVSGRILGALGGIKTVKLSGAEEREVKNYEKISDEAYSNYVDRALLSNKFTFWQGMLTEISYALVLGYGGYLALEHKITPGDVVMFVSYLERLYSPIDELSSLWVTLQQNLASISRAFRLLDNNKEEMRGKELKFTKGSIEFKNVHFGYTPEREILKGLSLKFQPNKITAIVGGSGAGKTTTVDLLLKLYEPQSGKILIDGNLLADLDPSNVRSQIGMVATDGVIFSGSLADNIRYKKPTATDEEVLEAAKSAGLSNTIMRLPEGLQSKIGQNGMGLSIGEKQRVNIARVLLSQNKILVLDEATANLDYNTEMEVKKAIEKLRHNSTIIIIAHRYSMVHDADYIVVLDEGEVLEYGTPSELIKKEGWFADFANSVFEEEEGEEEIEEEEDEDEESDIE
jgi:ATP-binding cassette subfamily B protein